MSDKRKRRIRLLPILMLLLVWLAACFALNAALVVEGQRLEVGAVVQTDVLAPMPLEDLVTTQHLQQKARQDVEPVLTYHSELAQQSLDRLDAYFASLRDFRKAAQQRREEIDPEGDWQSVLTREEMLSLAQNAGLSAAEEQGWSILQMPETELYKLEETLRSSLNKWLVNGGAGLRESERSVAMRRCQQDLTDAQLGLFACKLGQQLVSDYLVVTCTEDESATKQAKEQAGKAVTPVMIPKGDVVVSAGTEITPELWEKLQAWGLIESANAGTRIRIANVALSLCMVLLLAAYCKRITPKIWENNRQMLLIGILLTVTILLGWVCTLTGAHLVPVLFAVLLLAALVDKRLAMASGVMLSVLLGLMAGKNAAAPDSYGILTVTLSSLASGAVAVLLCNTHKRGALIGAGAGAGLAAVIIATGLHCLTGQTALYMLTDAAWLFGGHVLCGVLCVGTLAIWENLFDIATNARLNELSGTSHPLIRELIKEAPGTYHHSLMVATLAENAAEAVQADPLLCRVSACYHDVGKLRRPLYFKENQPPTENIHDTLKPAESAAAIIAHVRDGVQLLRRYKLPEAVIRIVQEHHGNTLVAYFYHKASETGTVQEKQFRYPWGRPSSRESAILMLADSCEAAVRSLPDPTPEAIRTMVHKVIRGKMEDGQLSRTPLTMQELDTIEKNFYATFLGAHHERIEYPETEQIKGKQNG